MNHLTFLALFMSSLFVARAENPPKLRIIASPDSTLIVCWHAEQKLTGIFGYAGQDARISNRTPVGGGLFKTLKEFRYQLNKQNLSDLKITTIPKNEDSSGWAVRKLTDKELANLK